MALKISSGCDLAFEQLCDLESKLSKLCDPQLPSRCSLKLCLVLSWVSVLFCLWFLVIKTVSGVSAPLWPLFSCVASFSLDRRICTLSYCNLLRRVCWIPLGGLILWGRGKEEECIREKREEGGKGWERGRERKLLSGM